MGAFVVSLLVGAAEHGSLALGQAKPEEENLPRVVPAPHDSPPEPQEYFDKRLLAAAKEAYEVALEEFKAERITDADVLYRWSMRWMKAEQAIGEDPVAAAKGHLRRMNVELTQVLDQLLTRRKATEQDMKYYAASGRFYGYEAMELVKKAEQAQLAKRAATPGEVVSPSPDAAVKAAETYLGAVLEGNYDEAAELAVPGSLATSKRLMDTIKGLISGKSISVLAIQNSGRRTAVLMQEAQSPDNTPENRARTQFTVVLEPNARHWLVTNVAVQTALSRNPPSRNSSLSQAGRTPTSAAAPKGTKVFSLKHAKASDLQQTISQLLEPHNSDLRVAVDARTNRVLVHGTREQMEEIEALIQQLDEPSAVKESLPLPEDPDITDDPPATDRRINEKTLKPPLQQQPAGNRS
jgi:hypothetical protein